MATTTSIPQGPRLLSDPHLNRGTAFTLEQRIRYDYSGPVACVRQRLVVAHREPFEVAGRVPFLSLLLDQRDPGAAVVGVTACHDRPPAPAGPASALASTSLGLSGSV